LSHHQCSVVRPIGRQYLLGNPLILSLDLAVYIIHSSFLHRPDISQIDKCFWGRMTDGLQVYGSLQKSSTRQPGCDPLLIQRHHRRRTISLTETVILMRNVVLPGQTGFTQDMLIIILDQTVSLGQVVFNARLTIGQAVSLLEALALLFVHRGHHLDIFCATAAVLWDNIHQSVVCAVWQASESHCRPIFMQQQHSVSKIKVL
jgi:hypothetical protein